MKSCRFHLPSFPAKDLTLLGLPLLWLETVSATTQKTRMTWDGFPIPKSVNFGRSQPVLKAPNGCGHSAPILATGRPLARVPTSQMVGHGMNGTSFPRTRRHRNGRFRLL